MYIANMFSNIAILLTFGTVYPPLAPLIVVGVLLDVTFTLRLLEDKLATHTHIIEGLMDVDVTAMLKHLVPFSALFYAFFLYDTSEKLWPPITMVCIPLLLFPIFWMTDRLTCEPVIRYSETGEVAIHCEADTNK